MLARLVALAIIIIAPLLPYTVTVGIYSVSWTLFDILQPSDAIIYEEHTAMIMTNRPFPVAHTQAELAKSCNHY